MKNTQKTSFIFILFMTAVLAVILKISVSFLIIYYGEDIQKAESWLKYIYDIKENIANEALNIKEPKIIIVSGSNSMFGLDNEFITQQTGLPVINMATHAALSFDYHMSKLQPYVKKGDIVILPLEFDYYAFDQNENGWMIENMAFWDKKYFQSMPLKKQILWALKLSPNFYWYSMKASLLRSKKLHLESQKDIINIWNNAIKNNEIKSQYSFLALRSDGTFLSPNESTFKGNSSYISEPNNEIVQKIINYKKEIEKKSATFILTYPVTIENELFQIDNVNIKNVINSFYTRLAEKGLHLACNLEDFHYERELFADTPYHLTQEGAKKRSEALGRCINKIIQKNN